MSDRLETDSGASLDEALVWLAVREHIGGVLPRLEKLWAYFRNPLEPVGVGASGSGARGWYRQAQEVGLPSRVTGRYGDVSVDDRVGARREVVIENDIAWRVQTMTDFMFGRPIRLLSTAGEPTVRDEVERVLDRVWEASGGIALLQDIATLGHVYGHVDLLVRVDEEMLRGASFDDPAELAAAAIRIEPIGAGRGVPIVSSTDYRELDGYAIHFERALNEIERCERQSDGGRRARLFGRERARGSSGDRAGGATRRRVAVTEVFERGRVRLFEDGAEIESRSIELLDGVPIVHVQNMSQPFRYSGLSEVEGLIPLQDELNTRLSDRASRVTMQSFKMYLAKGIEGFDTMPVSPGTVWSTDNPDARVESFGGDAASPSEESHIEQIREAMDKVSAVPPLAGGVIRAKVGNLSSATALRITLMGVVAKTLRKRVTYGGGIERVSRMVLEALDSAGVLRTSASERGLRVAWPEVLPGEQRDELAAAEKKIELGAPSERVLSDLGVSAGDPGIM